MKDEYCWAIEMKIAGQIDIWRRCMTAVQNGRMLSTRSVSNSKCAGKLRAHAHDQIVEQVKRLEDLKKRSRERGRDDEEFSKELVRLRGELEESVGAAEDQKAKVSSLQLQIEEARKRGEEYLRGERALANEGERMAAVVEEEVTRLREGAERSRVAVEGLKVERERHAANELEAAAKLGGLKAEIEVSRNPPHAWSSSGNSEQSSRPVCHHAMHSQPRLTSSSLRVSNAETWSKPFTLYPLPFLSRRISNVRRRRERAC